MKFTLSILFFCLVFSSCKKEVGAPIDLKYEYYPHTIGAWTEYEVIDIKHDLVSDTTRYQLKEVVAGSFVDDEGRKAYRIERFWRDHSNDSWTIKDVWTSVKNTASAEKVEEDVPFVKMVFPIDEFKIWDGNAKNTLSEWTHNYLDIDSPKSISGVDFDSTVTVVRRDNFNLIQYQKVQDVYAKNVGLIHTRYVDLEINNFDTTDITRGVEFYQRLIDFGF